MNRPATKCVAVSPKAVAVSPRLPELADLVADRVEVLVELGVADLEGRAHPVADLDEAVGHLARQVGQAALELAADERQQGRDDEDDRAEDRQPGGRSRAASRSAGASRSGAAGPSAAARWRSARRPGDRPHEQGQAEEAGRDEQQAPGPLARGLDAGRHEADPGRGALEIGGRSGHVVRRVPGHGRRRPRSRQGLGVVSRGVGRVVGHDATVCCPVGSSPHRLGLTRARRDGVAPSAA